MAEFKSLQSDQITSKPSLSAKSVARVKKKKAKTKTMLARRAELLWVSLQPLLYEHREGEAARSLESDQDLRMLAYTLVWLRNQLIKCNLIDSLFYVYTTKSSAIFCDLQNNFTM